MALRYKILIMGVGFALFVNLWAQSQSTNAYFSVDRINKDDFEKAKCSKFAYAYNLFADSVVSNEITTKILQDVRIRFEKLDSVIRIDNYDVGLEGEEYENLFSIESLILLKPVEMYGFMLPSLHGCELYCYDAQCGGFLGMSLLPFAVSPGGIMVSQTEFDCDGFLDLHFYARSKSSVYEFLAFKDIEMSLCYINDYHSSLKYDTRSTSFWHDDEVLYISFQSTRAIDSEQMVYLKIKLPENQISYRSVKCMLENVMSNEALRLEPMQ